ncbi:MAG: non-heme iron oxygenase ferredoxin subunit [Burkholderiaceae bacterium]
MQADTKRWTQALESADLDEGSQWPVVVHGRHICLYRSDGTVFATDNICTHGNANLSDGYLEGYEIECPFHQGRFDIRTGEATQMPCTEAVATFPVQERDGLIWIAVAD